MSGIAYVFPGQGSQYVGMGKDLYEQSAAACAVFDAADEALGFSLSTLCFEGPDEELTRPVNAQPALLTMSMACLAAWKEAAGTIPAASCMAGHSLGEYTALCAAGSLTFQDAVRLARDRGRLMYEAGLLQPGGMAGIIAMSREALEAVCEEAGVYIANYNCPGQIAISGAKAKVKAASKLARSRGAKLAIPLQVSGAFHSPLMQSAADGLRPRIEAAMIAVPSVPVISNTAAQVLNSAASVREELCEQVCHSVQWDDTIRAMLTQGVDTFIEIGPGMVLTGLLKRIDPAAKPINIGSMEDIRALTKGYEYKS